MLLVMTRGIIEPVSSGSGNGLLPEGSKPLYEHVCERHHTNKHTLLCSFYNEVNFDVNDLTHSSGKELQREAVGFCYKQ